MLWKVSSRVDEILQSGSPRAALAAAEELLQLDDPANLWRAWGELGSARRACSDYLGAREAFAMAEGLTRTLSGLEQKTARLEIARRVGRLLVDLGNYDRARPLARWRLEEETDEDDRAIAAVDLAVIVYASENDSGTAVALLEAALSRSADSIRSYGLATFAWIAASDGNDVQTTACLQLLDEGPVAAGGELYRRWLHSIHRRNLGDHEAARVHLMEIHEAFLQLGAIGQAGSALLDAAICSLLAADDEGVIAAGGKAFVLLGRCGIGEARAALLLFAQAVQRGKLSLELAHQVRRRLSLSR